jgi:hypothetical protein
MGSQVRTLQRAPSQGAENQSEADGKSGWCTQIGAQISDADRRLLARVVEVWPRLHGSLKLAILAIVDAGERDISGLANNMENIIRTVLDDLVWHPQGSDKREVPKILKFFLFLNKM